MSKKVKLFIGLIIIFAFTIIAFFTFIENKVEYVNFQQASLRNKTVEVKGVWIKDKESKYDPSTNTFTFYMKDDSDNEMKVVLDGAKPNNFEVADAIVAKGKVKDGNFHAKEILTKCPSKYESQEEQVKSKSK